MHLIQEDDPSRVVLQPPPAPRKQFLQKNIEVSSRVRRKLNFDFCADTPNDEPLMKRLRINIPTFDKMLNNNQYNTEKHQDYTNDTNSSTHHQSRQIHRNEPFPPMTRIPNTEESLLMSDLSDDSAYEENSEESNELDTSIYSTPEKKLSNVEDDSPVDH